MPDDVAPADPAYRRRALALLLLAVILGAAAIQWGVPWLESVKATRPGVQRLICISFMGVIVLLGAAVVTSGRRIAELGRLTVQRQEFPPPGLKLLRDVRRVTGAGATLIGRGYVVIGRLLMVLAIALLGLGTYALVLLWPR